MPVGDVEVGFVSSLETEESVTENFLAFPNNIQPPVGGVIPWDTCESRIEGYRGQ